MLLFLKFWRTLAAEALPGFEPTVSEANAFAICKFPHWGINKGLRFYSNTEAHGSFQKVAVNYAQEVKV